MDNVNNLNRTSNVANNTPTQEPISLSALSRGKDESTTTVSINTTAGLTGASDVVEERRPVVRINTAKKINRNGHRTISASEEDKSVINPDDYIEPPKKEVTMSPRDLALNQLEQAVQRKQNEYRSFVQYAVEDDKENRERIEAGLEEANAEEVQYMPNELHTPMGEEDRSESMVSEVYVEEEEDTDEDLIGNGDETGEDFEPVRNVVFDRPEYELKNAPAEEKDSEPSYPYEEQVEDESVATTEPDDEYKYLHHEQADEFAIEEVAVVVGEDEDHAPNEGESHKKTVEYFDTTSMSITSTIPDDASAKEFADIEAEDFEDVTVATEENLTDEQILAAYESGTENLKKEIFEKIINAGKKLNTAQFVVSNKVVSLKDALKNSETNTTAKRTASWPMVYAGRPFMSTALRGPEIAILADFDDSDSENGIGITREQVKIMFEHDANPYRPLTVEAWAKTIPFHDIDSIFAAMYIASLKGSNYMPYVCQKPACQHAYLSDDISIDKMVKFNSDEAKERFENIKKVDLTPENTGSYESVVSVINDRFAIGIKLPSVYTILYEQATLNSEFLRKHQSVASIMQYVDYIYMIDPDSSEFKPIGWKTYPGDITKSYKSKIATYAKIFSELDGTDFGVMISLINSMVIKANDMRGITYEVPSTKCPKCGSEIAAQPITPRSMVFTRQRLVALATTPTER